MIRPYVGSMREIDDAPSMVNSADLVLTIILPPAENRTLVGSPWTLTSNSWVYALAKAILPLRSRETLKFSKTHFTAPHV